MLKITAFLCRVKLPCQQFLMFFSFIIVTDFMNIFRNSCCSEVFLKKVALKNFAIFCIKKRLQHRCIPMNIGVSPLAASAFLKSN